MKSGLIIIFWFCDIYFTFLKRFCVHLKQICCLVMNAKTFLCSSLTFIKYKCCKIVLFYFQDCTVQLCLLNVLFEDLFEKLVPLAVHEALQAFEGRKAEVVNREIGRLREATTLMNGLVFNSVPSIKDIILVEGLVFCCPKFFTLFGYSLH